MWVGREAQHSHELLWFGQLNYLPQKGREGETGVDWNLYKPDVHCLDILNSSSHLPAFKSKIYYNHLFTFTIMLTTSFVLTALLASGANAMPLEKRACDNPDVNSATIDLIKQWEGFVPSPAPDPVGYPTVGYGHLCQSTGCSEVDFSFPLSESDATALLTSDIVVCLPFILFRSLARKLTLPKK